MSVNMNVSENKSHEFNPSILREYDIRGIVDETVTGEDAFFIGKAFATCVLEKNAGKSICLCYDGRLSSPDLEEQVAQGMKSAGADVIRIGLGPTPMLYFSVYHFEAAGGIMITGSHNPPTHNGFKMMIGTAPFFGEDIKKLGQIAAEGKLLDGQGSIKSQFLEDEYVEELASHFSEEDYVKDLKVAWDAGNGASGNVLRKLCEQIPGEHITLFDNVDGTFPNHHPDPSVAKNLESLIETVITQKCDLGIAFDGDGDRIGIVDNRGRIVWGDQLMVLFASDVLIANDNATIIADVKASQTLFDMIEQFGGKPLIWKTGHSLIKTKMKETGALLAGEMSGHIFFADEYYGFDDALYAAVRLLHITTKLEDDLATIFGRIPATESTPEMRIDCADDRKFDVIDEIKDRLKSMANIKVNDIDGARVMNEDGWWLIRASNTQAAIVARCESSSEEGLQRLKDTVNEQLSLSGVEV